MLLDESSANLRSTSSAHSSLALVMGTSKQLITALERSDWLDRVLILAGLAFFALTAAFILKQRILDRGLRIAFWWTRFLPGGGLGGLLSDEGVEGLEGWKDVVRAEEGSGGVVATAAGVLSTMAGALTTMTSSAATVSVEDAVESIVDTVRSAVVDSSSVDTLEDATRIPAAPSATARDEL